LVVLVLVADDGVLWKVRPDRLKCGSVEVDVEVEVEVDVDVGMEVQVQVSDAINAAGGSGRARCRANVLAGLRGAATKE
jgi:hypothetical protein